MNTIFTKIINREIPSNIIYEDDLVIAFLDITQATKGHSLVVTKNPYENLYSVPDETLMHLIKVVKHLSIKIKNAFMAEGINLVNNNEPMAGQTVFHYHMHIIPRYSKSELQIHMDNNMNFLTQEELKKRAATIIATL